MMRGAWQIVSCLLVVVSAGLGGGCSKKDTKPAKLTDAQLLEVLAEYDPVVVKYNDKGNVHELKLERPLVDDRALERLSEFADLAHLSLYASSITDDGLAHLAKLRKLGALGLGRTRITRAGLAHLEVLPSLRYMWISVNTQFISKDDIEDFKAKAVPGITVYEQ